MNSALKEKICSAHFLSYNTSGQSYVQFKNFNELIQDRLLKNAPDLFLKFYDDKEITEITYEEFIQRVFYLSKILSESSVKKETRVATFSHNHLDTVILYFALWNIGAVVVPINVNEDENRIKYIIDNSSTKLIFTRTEYFEKMQSLTDVEVVNFDEFEYQEELESPKLNYDVTDFTEAMIVYTSGTTGNPKGVVLYQYNLLVDAHYIAKWHKLKNKDTMMCVLPIHHVNGTVVTLITPFYYGGKVILNRKFSAINFFDLLEENKVKVVSVVPTLLQFLLHTDIDISKYNLRNFFHFICGAGPLTSELAKNFEEKFDLRIVHGYGLSETTCYSCFMPVDLSDEEHFYWQNELGFPSIGIPLRCNEMDIHDTYGQSVEESEKGEIVIRGHNVMKYYFNNDRANQNAFTYDWFRSGDEGFFKKDTKGNKYFFITGRLKELIIRGGVNISPLEIDEVLSGIEYIKSGISVGFENDWYGEEVGALVSLKDEYKNSNEEEIKNEILNICKEKLSFNKSPKVVVFTDNIPVTSTGKYKRNEAKDLFIEFKTLQFKK